jgi:RNA polymerase sigma factor (sigma-70 family)
VSILDDFIEQYVKVAETKQQDLGATKKREIDLWHAWNTGGRKPEDLKPLHKSFEPMISRASRQFTNRVEIPTSAIKHEFNKQFVNAVKTFNPDKKTQLSSWVTTHLRRGIRFVKTYQNTGKISEQQSALISKYDQTKQDLTDRYGYEPDTHLIAEHMKVPVKKIVQLQKERRADIPTSSLPFDPAEMLRPKEIEAIRILQYDTSLTPKERTVYEYTYGLNGKPMLKPGEVAKAVKLSPSKVSRIRNKLADMVQEASNLLE